ncbi:tannase/feruloyl esterase family alpha/beta hydrolase [Alloyangia pacifica]|uniref:tannase/feruloyl esterase family alpha/beta hydrolase n=1 Tax=Alloyangia pacifica TaxID=311180 RepID=UPI0021E53C79|nr:tannase/feruloyl esterase family alpha/beta hydrolase [Alloyangia pacifica]
MKLRAATLALLASASYCYADQTPEECSALRDTVFPGGYVTSVRVQSPEGLPQYCEVRATALPAISIEVRLPLSGWNGKFYQAGCGGFCGILGRADGGESWVNAMRPGLERGYATATSDSGHFALSVTEATWAQDNPNAERDWGWRSIGETNRVAQAMIDAFYGAPSTQAIFQGCSTGGRMAHVAAQRYPEMFDGIISGAPAMVTPGWWARRCHGCCRPIPRRTAARSSGPMRPRRSARRCCSNATRPTVPRMG